MDHITDPNQFIHVRTVLSMVVSLALARLLTGLARFAQHPQRLKVYGVHLLWVAFMLLMLLHFWWWEFALSRVPEWHFGSFAFVVGYSAMLYMLSAILFPDDIREYAGYRDYFMSRRKWFFGLLALVFLLDVVDTRLKGGDHLQAQALEYDLRTAGGVVLCVLAAWLKDPRFHWALAIGMLVYEVSWILRLYDVLA